MAEILTENGIEAFAKALNKGNWKPYKFSEIAFNIVEKVTPKDSDLEYYIGLEHLDSGSIHIKRVGDPSTLDGDKLKIHKGDIIVGKRNAYLKRAALCEIDSIASAHSFVLRANSKVLLPELFPFFMLSEAFWETAIRISVGSLSPTINWKALAIQEFVIPPINQQVKLAELLWTADRVLEGYAQMIKTFQVTIESCYHKYFIKSNISFKPLGEVAEIVMGQSPDGSTYNTAGNGLPLLNGPTEFTERYPIKIQWTTNPTKTCKEGDLLLCVRGSTTGRMNISNDIYCIGRGIAAVRGGSSYKTDFLEHVLIRFINEIKRLAVGSTFPNIDSKSLRSILVPNYDLNTQESIAVKLNALASERKHASNLLDQSRAIQKQLINQIFSADTKEKPM